MLILSFLIVKPFLPAVVLGAVIAYLFHPFFRWLKKYLKNSPLCAVITMLIIATIFIIPVVFVLKSVINEVSDFYTNSDKEGGIFTDQCIEDTPRCKAESFIVELMSDEHVVESFKGSLSKIYEKILGSASYILFSIPLVILNVLIVIFTTFYLFVDWDIIVKELDRLLPFKEDLKRAFAKQVRDIIHATVYGTLIVALVQGTLGTIAFVIFDSTRTPFLWGMIMAVAALIPFVGTALVWVPIGVIQLISGYAQGSGIIIWKAIGLIFVGATLISTIDNVIKPKIIGKRASIHPLLVLLGVLGGVAFFGFIGVIVGPLVMALLATLIRVYKKEKNAIVG